MNLSIQKVRTKCIKKVFVICVVQRAVLSAKLTLTTGRWQQLTAVVWSIRPTDGVGVDPVPAAAHDGVFLGQPVRASAQQDLLGHHDRLHRGQSS